MNIVEKRYKKFSARFSVIMMSKTLNTPFAYTILRMGRVWSFFLRLVQLFLQGYYVGTDKNFAVTFTGYDVKNFKYPFLLHYNRGQKWHKSS